MPRPQPLFFVVFTLTLGLDLASKYWAQHVLAPAHRIDAVPWLFEFTYVQNRGVAFGLGAGWDWLLPVATAGLIAVGIWYTRTLNWRLTEVSIIGGLLLGGAIGNLTDRIRYGYVVDFFDFSAIAIPGFLTLPIVVLSSRLCGYFCARLGWELNASPPP